MHEQGTVLIRVLGERRRHAGTDRAQDVERLSRARSVRRSRRSGTGSSSPRRGTRRSRRGSSCPSPSRARRVATRARSLQLRRPFSAPRRFQASTPASAGCQPETYADGNHGESYAMKTPAQTRPCRRSPAWRSRPDPRMAQTGPGSDTTLPEVKVQRQRRRAPTTTRRRRASAAACRRRIRDIPQSVTVINSALMQAQGATSLARCAAQRARHHDGRRGRRHASATTSTCAASRRAPTSTSTACATAASTTATSSRSTRSRCCRAVVDAVRPRLDRRRHQPGEQAADARAARRRARSAWARSRRCAPRRTATSRSTTRRRFASRRWRRTSIRRAT